MRPAVPLRLRLDVRWLLVGLLWLLFLAAALWLYVNHPNGAGDFDIYYRAALRIIHGTPLYAELQRGDYMGPPLVVQLAVPIVALAGDFRQASVIWFFANALAITGTYAALLRWLPQPRMRPVMAAIPVFFTPVLITLWWGQSSPLVFALTAGAWIARSTKRPLLAGILLAVAVWTKFYPGLLIVYFLWKRDWPVAVGAVIGTIAVVAVQAAVSGLDTFLYYLTNVLPALFAQGEPELIYASHSILSFVQRLFGESPQVIPLVANPRLLTISRAALSLALLGVTALASAQPMKRTSASRFNLEYILVLQAALLLGSTLGTYSLISVLLAYVLILRETPRRWMRAAALWLFITALFITLHPLLVIGYLQPPSDNTLPALSLSLPFFAMVMLWGTAAWMLLRQHRARQAASAQDAALP